MNPIRAHLVRKEIETQMSKAGDNFLLYTGKKNIMF